MFHVYLCKFAEKLSDICMFFFIYDKVLVIWSAIIVYKLVYRI